MYKRILIATDGSDLARKGLEHGLALAKALGAKVAVVTISEPVLAGYEDALGWGGVYAMQAEYSKAQEESAERVLKGALSAAEAAGVAATAVHLKDRQAAEGILEVARVQESDLIVMASHGRRGLGRLLLGSQANEVLIRSKVPVLVVR
ncbi:universal stress protein [Pseudoxanthomonas putridarboris]|uniref:Universal stress protein n=1 Tax=Pseudoxanthomonas putridarboris TaxID=752605 RepID=A0ABU9J5R0_9GAMM